MNVCGLLLLYRSGCRFPGEDAVPPLQLAGCIDRGLVNGGRN
jgi:hypothetical protein